MKILRLGYSHNVYFDCYNENSTHVSLQKTYVYLVQLLQHSIYLQHGGGNYCSRQNGVAITPCVLQLKVKKLEASFER